MLRSWSWSWILVAVTVQASDVAISQFRFLVPLLFCHGALAHIHRYDGLCKKSAHVSTTISLYMSLGSLPRYGLGTTQKQFV